MFTWTCYVRSPLTWCLVGWEIVSFLILLLRIMYVKYLMEICERLEIANSIGVKNETSFFPFRQNTYTLQNVFTTELQYYLYSKHLTQSKLWQVSFQCLLPSRKLCHIPLKYSILHKLNTYLCTEEKLK